MRDIITARTRSRTESSGLVSMTKVWLDTGLPYSGWPRNGLTMQKDTVTSDTSTRGFKKLSGKGILLCKDYRNTVAKLTAPKGYYYQEHYISGWRPHVLYETSVLELVSPTNISWPSWPGMTNVDVLHSQAVQALYAKIDASDLQSFVALAELKKTVGSLHSACELVYNTCSQAVGKQESVWKKYARQIEIARLTKNPKKAIARLLARRAAEIGNIWLLARYGIRPLVYDVNSCIRALKRGSKVKLYLKYSANGTPVSGESLPLYGNVAVTEGIFGYKSERLKSTHVTCGCICIPQFDTQTLLRLDRLPNLPETAWELIPYSFVVDWLFNVGTVISALTPNVDCPVAASWSKVVETNTSKFELTGCSSTKDRNAARGTVAGFTYSYEETIRTRYAYPELSAVPSLKVRLDVSKAIDALFLCRSVYRLLSGVAKRM